MQRLVRHRKGPAGEEIQAAEEPQTAAAAREEPPVLPDTAPWAPVRRVRTCVARLPNSRAFGPLVAGEAQARDFSAAGRRAFVADGQASNGAIQRGYFPDFVALADVLHVVCSLFSAAYAVAAEESARWTQYETWLRACWQGRVADVLGELERQQEAVGRPPPREELAANDPRRVVAAALTYVRNHAERMNYPEYRRQGLPTTSSLVEALVGEFNARVKGKSKFWNRPGGAEAIVQVRAALLSEDGRLERHLATRPGSPYRRRKIA